MISNKSFKNLIMSLSIILLAIVLFMNYEKIADIFDKKSELEYVDSPLVKDFKDGKILGKYSEKEFKNILIRAKNSFSYDKNKSKLNQLEELKVYIPETQDIINKYEKIPESVIKSVLFYPENFLWVHGFTNADDTENIITKQEKNLDIPYFLQTDTRWGYKKVGNYRFGVVGCGPTSMSMVYMALTKDYSMTPDKMMDFSIKNGYYRESIGTLWDFMTEGAEKLGLKSKEVPLDKKRMKEELNNNRLIIASVGPGDFTKSGHLLVIVGHKDGKFKIYDPNSWVNTEKTWEYEMISPQIKNMWSIGK